MSTKIRANGSSRPLPETLAKGFLQTVQKHPKRVAFSTFEGEVLMTWKGVYDKVKTLAAGLSRLGVGHGDTVALMFKSRYEYMIADLAVMCLGACPFSLYPTLPPVQIVPLVQNAGCKIVICESVFLSQLLAAREKCPGFKQIVLLEGNGPEGTIAWGQVEAEGEATDFDFEASIASIRPEDLLTIIYTSGTTGDPKGVEITHENMMQVVADNLGWSTDVWASGKRILAWLPHGHVVERTANYYMPLLGGCQIAFCDDPSQVGLAVSKFKPQLFFGPPRFWEKVKEALQARWAALTDSDRAMVEKALQAGMEKIRLEQAGQPVPAALAETVAVSDREIFAQIRKQMGFDGQDAYFFSGGAGAPMAVLEFFFAIGVPVGEVYGMSETSAAGFRPPIGRHRLGTVGTAQGCEVKLAADSELLLRSKAVMHGYRKRPDLTAEVLDADGWLHTGDIVTIDHEGYVKIVDRKKDIIINSMGKNMSPAKIEGALVQAGRFISQAIVIGDGRNYNVALVTLDSLFVKDWAVRQGLENATDISAIGRDPKVIAAVEAEVSKANESLARVEQIKKFYIIGGEWMPGSEEVTLTFKLKRPVIIKKYASEIEAMYDKI